VSGMGLQAARAAVKAVKKGDPRKAVLEKAHQSWNRKYGRNLRIAMEINKRMAGFSDPQWDKAVQYLRRLSDHQFLKFLRTDFSLGLFLKIVSRNPDLARKALVRQVLKEMK